MRLPLSRLLATLSLTGNESPGYLQAQITNTDVLAQWAEHGAVELLLVGAGTSNRAEFESREAAYGPRLDLVYTAVPEPGPAALLLIPSAVLLLGLRRRKIAGQPSAPTV